MFLGWREMRNSPGRYLGIVALITLITYLVFFLTGLAYGLAQANRSALDRFEARGMVISAYANDSLAASRIKIDELGETDPKLVQPLLITPAVVRALDSSGAEREEDQFGIAVFGFDQESFLAPKVISGQAPSKAGEVAVSESMVDAHNVQVGDTLQMEQTDTQLKIVGITETAQYSVGPVAYTSIEDAAASRPGQQPMAPAANSAQAAPGGAGAPPAAPLMVSGFVLHPDAAADLDKINETNKGAVYLDMPSVIWALPGYAAQVYTFAMMIGFLVAICAIVIGIFMYILTIQKKPVFGVLKAQGIPNRYIAMAVLFQTAAVAAVGIGLGLALTVASSLPLPAAVPYLANWPFYGLVALIIFIVAGIGAQISVRQVSKIDPLEAMS